MLHLVVVHDRLLGVHEVLDLLNRFRFQLPDLIAENRALLQVGPPAIRDRVLCIGIGSRLRFDLACTLLGTQLELVSRDRRNLP